MSASHIHLSLFPCLRQLPGEVAGHPFASLTSHTERMETVENGPGAIRVDATDTEVTVASAQDATATSASVHRSQSANNNGEPSASSQPSTATSVSRAQGHHFDNAKSLRRDPRKPYARKQRLLVPKKGIKNKKLDCDIEGIDSPADASHARPDSPPPLVESDEVESASDGTTEGGSV